MRDIASKNVLKGLEIYKVYNSLEFIWFRFTISKQYNSGVGFSRSRFCDGDLSWNGKWKHYMFVYNVMQLDH